MVFNTFNNFGNISRKSALYIPPTPVIGQILIVGAGAGAASGGGGGGAVLYNSTFTFIRGTTYNITIGAGQTGSISNNGNPPASYYQTAPSSSISYGSTTITALGGGSGGINQGPARANGVSGGCGGGGCSYGSGLTNGGSSTQTTPSGFIAYGNAGGSNGAITSPNYPCGGGGGAGSVGGAGTSSKSGDGGAAKMINIIPTNNTGFTPLYNVFGGGGGGSMFVSGGAIGVGGSATDSSGNSRKVGGDGGSNVTLTGFNGLANTGSGGGGGNNNYSGGNGANGVVIIAVPYGSEGTAIGHAWNNTSVGYSSGYNNTSFWVFTNTTVGTCKYVA